MNKLLIFLVASLLLASGPQAQSAKRLLESPYEDTYGFAGEVHEFSNYGDGFDPVNPVGYDFSQCPAQRVGSFAPQLTHFIQHLAALGDTRRMSQKVVYLGLGGTSLQAIDFGNLQACSVLDDVAHLDVSNMAVWTLGNLCFSNGAFAGALKHWDKLQSLNISDIRFANKDDSGIDRSRCFEGFISTLKKNKFLKRLLLRRTDMTSREVATLISSLSSIVIFDLSGSSIRLSDLYTILAKAQGRSIPKTQQKYGTKFCLTVSKIIDDSDESNDEEKATAQASTLTHEGLADVMKHYPDCQVILE